VVACCWVLILAWAPAAGADRYLMPSEKEYLSADRSLRFRVIPGKRFGTFLRTPPASRPGRDTRRPAVGVLERRRQPGLRYQILWSRPLLNDVAPAAVVVHPAGSYVVAIDNWAHRGYGAHAVAIYGRKGDLVRAFSLLDLLLPGEIARLEMSVSSVWWMNEAAFDRDVLTLTVAQEGARGEGLPPLRLRLEAATGRLLRHPADLAKIEQQKDSCRLLASTGNSIDLPRCMARVGSRVWCNLCEGRP
jgi:hypothetical protein